MRKITLYMAVSTDGFIADLNDNTPWSDAEWEQFKSFVGTQDAIIMGRKTFDLLLANDDFVTGPIYYVATKKQDVPKPFSPITIQMASDLPEHKNIGIIGGGDLNGSVAELGVIDEIILDIEPIILGQGMHLFGDHDVQLDLELIGIKPYGTDSYQHHYTVKTKR